jgi:hypothetical protein
MTEDEIIISSMTRGYLFTACDMGINPTILFHMAKKGLIERVGQTVRGKKRPIQYRKK